MGTCLVHVFLQGGGVDKRDGGLLHAEEAVLDVSSAHGANHVPFRKGALQQQGNSIGDRRDGRGSSDLALRGGEARFVDPGTKRRSVDMLHDQIRAASPVVKDVVHPWHAGCARVGPSLLKEMRLGPGLTGEARVSPLDEYRWTGAGEGRDYVVTGTLGTVIDDVPLAVRELGDVHGCSAERTIEYTHSIDDGGSLNNPVRLREDEKHEMTGGWAVA